MQRMRLKIRRTDANFTEAVMPYAMIALCIFMVGQAFYELVLRPKYPDDFRPIELIEGEVNAIGWTSGKRRSKTFSVTGDGRAFVLPRNLPKAEGYQPKVGDFLTVKTSPAAVQGNWLNPDQYYQVMALELDGQQVYSVKDYAAYKEPTEMEHTVMITLAATIILLLTFFLFWLPAKQGKSQ